MYKLKNRSVLMATAVFLCSFCLGAFAGDELLLPMPGQKSVKKAKTAQADKTAKKTKTKQTAVKPSAQGCGDANQAILPMPSQIRHKKNKPTIKQPPKLNENKTENENRQSVDEPIIEIALPKAAEETPPQEAPGPEAPQTDENVPVPPDEVVVSADKALEEIIPKPDSQEPAASVMTNGESYPIFPKDTSSAIFMVMKSWQCEDYSFGSLLKQAVEAYGTEASDQFAIQGLDGVESELLVTVEEEDITLDELLDVVGQKVGRDWGVDIPSKIIYFYPPGISASTYSAW